MHITAIVYSSSDVDNITVSVNGINGRLDEKQLTNLNQGLNEFFFSYNLPRCNTCGGINAGDYEIVCKVNYGNEEASKNKFVNIKQ